MAEGTAAERRGVVLASPRALLRGLKREIGDQERRTAYLMVVPTLLVIMVIAVLPMIHELYLSLHEATPTTTGPWVGFDNYIEMASDRNFLDALGNSAIFTAASLVAELVLGMALAMGLNRYFIGRGAARAIALVPWAYPTVISAAMWRLMYQDEGGIISFIAEQLQIVGHPILTEESSLMGAAILVDVWKTTPFMAILCWPVCRSYRTNYTSRPR